LTPARDGISRTTRRDPNCNSKAREQNEFFHRSHLLLF
jgi:hypothetical protein